VGEGDNKDHMGNKADKDQEGMDPKGVDVEDSDQEGVDQEDDALDIDDHQIYEYFFWEDMVERNKEDK
jgi:hypothetical protein